MRFPPPSVPGTSSQNSPGSDDQNPTQRELSRGWRTLASHYPIRVKTADVKAAAASPNWCHHSACPPRTVSCCAAQLRVKLVCRACRQSPLPSAQPQPQAGAPLSTVLSLLLRDVAPGVHSRLAIYTAVWPQPLPLTSLGLISSLLKLYSEFFALPTSLRHFEKNEKMQIQEWWFMPMVPATQEASGGVAT